MSVDRSQLYDRLPSADLIAHCHAAFERRWCPEDPREREQFRYDLLQLIHTLIHTIYSESSKPFVEHLTKIIAALPTQPFIINK